MPFPHVIDNTIRKAIATCHTQAAYRHIDNIRPIGAAGIDLHFGGCFAHGMEVIRKRFFGMPNGEGDGIAEDAIHDGIDAAVAMWGDYVVPHDYKGYKTLDRLVSTFHFYFTQWPLGEDGLTPVEDGIECMFDFELPIAHPDTGILLRYAGRYDMLASDKNGRLYVVDEKTTSRLGDSWISQWDLDTQMTGYIWSVQQQHELLERGLRPHGPYKEMPELMAQIRGISILKNDFGHAEIPIIRPQWMIDRWYTQLLRDVTQFKKAYERSKWSKEGYDMALHSNACSAYNRDCDYKMLCLSPNPERLVPGSYQTVIWNPLAGKK